MTRQEELYKKVDEMHIVIAGNPQYGQKGIKDLLDEHGNRIKILETKEAIKESAREKAEVKKMVKVGILSGGVGSLVTIIAPKTFLAKAWTAIISIFF